MASPWPWNPKWKLLVEETVSFSLICVICKHEKRESPASLSSFQAGQCASNAWKNEYQYYLFTSLCTLEQNLLFGGIV